MTSTTVEDTAYWAETDEIHRSWREYSATLVDECPFCGDTDTRPFRDGSWYCVVCHQHWTPEHSVRSLPELVLPAAEVAQAEAWLSGVSRLAKALGGDYETAITVATAVERNLR